MSPQSSAPSFLISSPSSNPPVPGVLPAERVFSIQLGSRIFKLSGASIMSDAPSYFSNYFENQLRTHDGGPVPALCIDRDPETFAEIVRHLRGYHVQPQDGIQYARMFADAQFYSLPRLLAQLFECDIAIEIGTRHFRVPRSLLTSPENSPNYFTHSVPLHFANPNQVFPGLDRSNLLRPPSIRPLHIDNRDPDIFADILRMVRGYDVHVHNEEHRAALLRDSRYYQFRQVEQRLIPHDISYNIARRKEEIVLRLEHVRLPGLKFIRDDGISDGVSGGSSSSSGGPAGLEWLYYSRPLVDEKAYELIIQIDGGSMLLDIDNMRFIAYGELRGKMQRFVGAVKKRFGEAAGVKVDTEEAGPTTSSVATSLQQGQDIGFQVQFARETAITLDGVYLGRERWSADLGTILHPAAGAPGAASTRGTGSPYNGITLRPGPEPGPEPRLEPGPDTPIPPLKRPRPAELEAETIPSKRVIRTIDTPQPAQQQPQPQPKSSANSAAGTQPMPDRLNTPAKPRRRWMLNNSQWRLRVRPIVNNGASSGASTSSDETRGEGKPDQASGNWKLRVIFVAVKIEAFSGECGRNKLRRFL